MNLGDFKPCFISISRVFVLTREYFLRSTQSFVSLVPVLRIGNFLPSAGSNQAGDTSINTNSGTYRWQWLNGLVIYQQRNCPTSRRLQFNCNGRWGSPFRQL